MASRYLNKYNDVLLFIILIPLINTINYHLTYSTIRWDWYTYTTYLIDTVQGYIAWWLIRKIILWLDNLLPYQAGFSKRIFLQILCTNLIAQGFIILATEAINTAFSDQPLPSNFYTYNLFIFFIWILVINGIYVGMYFHNQWQETQQLREHDLEVRAKGIDVQLGKKIRNLRFEEIASLYSEEGSTYLLSRDGNRFLLDRSLSGLQKELPEEAFFRLNRAFIAHRDSLEGYRKGAHGKLLVQLREIAGHPGDVPVSRITAPDFKKWFHSGMAEA